VSENQCSLLIGVRGRLNLSKASYVIWTPCKHGSEGGETVVLIKTVFMELSTYALESLRENDANAEDHCSDALVYWLQYVGARLSVRLASVLVTTNRSIGILTYISEAAIVLCILRRRETFG
jgi:hypothetical protein